jgi:signal transduction histidine kinase
MHALNRSRADFSAEAGVMHRLLSQQVRQHETLIETIALLQPAPAKAGALPAEQRLSAVHPAVLQVFRRDDVSAWPEELDSVLDAALQRSTAAGRAVAADLGAAGGGLWLVRSGKPASFALQFDLRQLVKDALDSPFGSPSAVAAWLEQGSQNKLMLTGQGGTASPGPWRHHFRQTLTAGSVSVDLVATRPYDLLEWPWEVLAAWCLATSFLGLGLAAWLQSRSPVRPRSAGRFGFDDDDAQGPTGRSADWTPRRAPADWSQQRARASATSHPLSVTLRELDVEPPELTVARGAIDQAARESRRSTEMIANLRRNAQQPVREALLQPLLWDELLRDALELIEPACKRLGITTTLITDDEAAFVLADPVALEQVISRLLDQALKSLSVAPDSERQLDVTLAAQPDLAVLSVHDTGVEYLAADGVSASEAAASSSPRTLELRHCQQLLADMGGRLTIEARVPRGAVVRVALPRVKG